MTYREFKDYCVVLLCFRMSQITAESLFDWIFPEEYKDNYEQKLKESDEFLNYATRVLQ